MSEAELCFPNFSWVVWVRVKHLTLPADDDDADDDDSTPLCKLPLPPLLMMSQASSDELHNSDDTLHPNNSWQRLRRSQEALQKHGSFLNRR